MSQPVYEVGLACLNGHTINGFAHRFSEYNAKFCGRCGAATISTCPKCKANIRGGMLDDGWEETHIEHWNPPAYCHECGTPYPWTQNKLDALSEAIDELDELSAEDREKLKRSIPDVINNTPKTETAVARFKKAIIKTGEVGGKMLTDVLCKVATDVVIRSMGM